MTLPIIGTEALARGTLTRGQLRWHYRAIFPNVYVRADQELTLPARTVGAWLWSGRKAVIAGRAAAAMHGALWVDDDVPIELVWRCGRPPPGIVARNERIARDEIIEMAGVPVTNPARTAWDLSRHLNRGGAVAHLDALARATGIEASNALILAQRYPGARGLVGSNAALAVMDGGAQSPKETWLRLVLIDGGLPSPRTQIRVSDGFNVAYLDMGWEGPKVSVEYDGDQHRSDRGRYVRDIGRQEMVDQLGWCNIRVVAEHSPRFILHRVGRAFNARGALWRPDCA